MYGIFELSYREYYSGIVKGTKNGIKSKNNSLSHFVLRNIWSIQMSRIEYYYP